MTGTESNHRERSTLEWFVFGASVLVIAGIVGILGWAEVGSSHEDARFETVVQPIRQEGGSFHVPVDVKNVGGATAASVSVFAEVGRGAEATRVQDTIDFLFAGEQHVLTFVFDEDPLEQSLRVGVEAYEEP